MARLKFFIGVCLALTLTGIVFVVLYSLIFVTQPLNAISPIDQKFFELIVPIATFLTGTLSGIMLAGRSKEDQEAMLAAQKQAAANADSAAKNSAVTHTPTGGTPNAATNFSSGRTSAFGAAPAAGFGAAGSFGTPAAAALDTFGGGSFGGVPSTGAARTEPTFSNDWSPQVVAGFGGKPAPVQPPQPLI